MWWLLLSLLWWWGTVAVSAPGPEPWNCPEIQDQPVVECSCDMPHTLRCSGNRNALEIIGEKLRSLKTASVSLLDCSVQNVSSLAGLLFEGVSLHGLVISSGVLREIHNTAFEGLAAPLQALGLPNNQLSIVPTLALKSVPELERLDLSGNKIKILDIDSFKGIRNLTFIELSNNLIAKISHNAFSNMSQLRILRLRSNKVQITTISDLDSLPALEELDLSENALLGPLGPKTFPKMNSLKDLQISHNSLSSIKMNSFVGAQALTSLALHHNQIDVLEDNAFSNLGKLVNLDLSHNRIVAVSGGSLTHLISLKKLDLRYNFLRALTPDLVIPLTSLESLQLDENDISIVSSDALRNVTLLKRLTLADNPLNCDCSLIEFAVWLKNSSLSVEDKSSPICATPPLLENGLLLNVPLKDLLCEVDDSESLSVVAPIKSRINLQSLKYDGKNLILKWKVDESATQYTCDAIYVYEEEASSEVLLASNSLKCNSSVALDPKVLTVAVPNSTNLQVGHRYRYCVVLLQSEQDCDDLSLVLGCSDVLPLVQNVKVFPHTEPSTIFPRIISLQTNLTNQGLLVINLNIYPVLSCEVNVVILEKDVLVSQQNVNCSDPKYTYAGLHHGQYRICANIIAPASSTSNKPKCVTIFKNESYIFSRLDIAFISFFLILCFMIISLIWGVRKVLSRPKITTHQCYMPPEFEEPQHNKYVKLQATTKL